jgi:phosphate starvation-inducible PhoH-like protein
MVKRAQKQVVEDRWNKKGIEGRVVRDVEHSYIKPPVQAKNLIQKDFLKALNEKQVVVFSAPAGCGKSYLTMSMATDWLKKGVFNKLLMSRPSVGMGKTLGLVPGDLRQKYELYLLPMIDVIKQRYGVGFYESSIGNGTIELAPLEYIRGRSIDQLVVLEESQNVSPDEMYTMITRVGDTGKLIIIGDPTQRDLAGEDGITWLKRFVERHRLYEHFAFIEATSEDIVRSGLCKDVVKAKEWDIIHKAK